MEKFYLLNALMILGALLAIWVPELMAAIICMGIVGFGLALYFLFLGAPDLAIVQIVVETLTLIILIAAIIKTTPRDTGEEPKPLRLLMYLGAIVFFAIFLTHFIKVSMDLPELGKPILRMAGDYIASGLQKTGAANLVGAVILNFRGYDTLGETTVLFAAVVGLVVVLRKIGRKNE